MSSEATSVNQSLVNKVSFKKIVCPFDLDAIFSMQFNATGLKSVLEFIFENLEKHSF